MRLPRVRGALDTPEGVISVADHYGPFVWLVMSQVVVPLRTRRPPVIGLRWWIQLAGHFPFVGIPIVASIGLRRSQRET